MREINSVLGFLSWAEATIRRSEIQVPIPIGLLRGYHDIFRRFEEGGSFALGQDASAWGLHLGSLLASVRQENGKTTGASALVDYFLGELYALAISARGTATLRTRRRRSTFRHSDQSRPMRTRTTITIRMTPRTPMPPCPKP